MDIRIIKHGISNCHNYNFWLNALYNQWKVLVIASGMFNLLQNDRLRRLVCLFVAVLISNVAAATCAVALAMCNDCPVETATHCVEMCEVDSVVNLDSSSDKKSERPTSFVDHASVPRISAQLISDIPASFYRPRRSSDSPPLNVLYCVYLK